MSSDCSYDSAIVGAFNRICSFFFVTGLLEAWEASVNGASTILGFNHRRLRSGEKAKCIARAKLKKRSRTKGHCEANGFVSSHHGRRS